MKKNSLFFCCILMLFISCSEYKQQSKEVFYETDMDEFTNPEPSIYERPEYAIRLASKVNSKSIWNATTGWNLLFSDIKVE